MKKILSIALAFAMLLTFASSALAVSWAAPAVSSTASPFAIEVIKLAASSDVTGAKYYTVLSDAAAYDLSNVYFAIKLSVPSYANANSYYGNSGFMSGDSVKVSVNFTNVSGKGSETYYIKLTNEAQTLWYNGSGFDATWTTSLSNSCGCGDSHILSAVAVGSNEITIKASVGASGELSNISIDGCYSVEKKTFYGVVPCVNCTPTNLSGYFISGDCSSYGVFFTTNSAGKVTAAYVADKCSTQTQYYGSVVTFDKQLFGWTPSGTYTDCYDNTCGHQAFALVELQKGDDINTPNWTTWVNDRKASGLTMDDTLNLFVAWANNTKANKIAVDSDNTSASTVTSDAYLYLYYLKDGEYKRVKEWDNIKPDDFKEITSGMTIALHDAADSTVLVNGAIVGTSYTKSATGASVNFFNTTDTSASTYDLVYGIDNNTILKRVVLGEMYASDSIVEYGKIRYVIGSATDWRLFKQTSATTVNCDSNEASYLNALNHVYALLGFTYADWAAGNVYMTEDLLLTNFGFTASVSDSKTWSAYTAAITVAPVAEVPATGSISVMGLAMIVLSAAAVIAKKKVRA